MLTLALLTALRCEAELAHARPGGPRQRRDAGRDREVLLHTAVYAGVPAANAAFGVAQRVLPNWAFADGGRADGSS